MDRKKVLRLVALLVAAGFLALPVLWIDIFPAVLLNPEHSTEGRLALYRLSNAVFTLSDDWTSSLIGQTGSSIPLYIFTSGLALALILLGAGPLAALVAALLGAIVYLLWMGDVIALRAIAWVPWVWSSVQFFQMRPAKKSLIPLLLTSIICAQSAGFLAPVAVAILLLLLSLDTRQKYSWPIYTLIVLPALWYLELNPIAELPQFTAKARVVPDDGIEGIVQPLLGRDYDRPWFLRESLKLYFLPLASWLTAFSALFLLSPGSEPKYIIASLLCASAAVLDCTPPERLAQILPAAVLSRTMPGLLPYSGASVLCLASIVFIAFGENSQKRLAIFAIALTPLVFFLPSAPELKKPQSPSREQLEEIVATPSNPLHRIVFSPSYYVLAREGLHAAQAKDGYEISYPCSVSGSNKANTELAFDYSTKTRWSSNSSGQHGKEWLQLACQRPLTLEGIELATARWHSDFPRGLRVLSADSCQGPWRVVYENPSWQGAVRLDQGYPVFHGQNDVRIFFGKEISGHCFRFEQIGRDRRFDWSVAEVRLYPVIQSTKEEAD